MGVRGMQTGIFFNFLCHKNEVYGKLKPLQEKVKYTFFSKLYYRVSRKKISSKNQPSYRHGGLEKRSLFDYKNGRYEKNTNFPGQKECTAWCALALGSIKCLVQKLFNRGTSERLRFVPISRFDP